MVMRGLRWMDALVFVCGGVCVKLEACAKSGYKWSLSRGRCDVGGCVRCVLCV